MSFLSLTTGTLITLGVVVAAIFGAAVYVSPHWLARRYTTILGLSVPAILVLFACAYGAIALADPGSLQLDDSHIHHLREPLLLSLSLLTTVGLLDLQLHGWVRSVAYVEMLLVASLAGGAAVIAAQRASRALGDVLGELRRDRDRER